MDKQFSIWILKLYEINNTKTRPNNQNTQELNSSSASTNFINALKNNQSRPLNYLLNKIFIAVTVFLLLSLNIVNAQTYDFRKISWGMNKTQVENAELPMHPTVAENRLIYIDTVADTPFSLIYTFNEKSELVAARYVLDKVYIDHDFYINEYSKFKALLKEKYNMPVKDIQNWTASIQDKDSSNWANELEKGNMELNAIWKTPRTMVSLLVTKYDVVHMIIDYKAINSKKVDISKYTTKNL